ncbi:hypothetical protein TWF730_008769 [Orbilia blumenaviensis]|uniref:Cryptic loci regulator 2 N-terminal domain-containing protein n=1 Tax=Orbilia blumenaviensis TaxID=1796055 RepID=A0AAV9V9U7_9PEZI
MYSHPAQNPDCQSHTLPQPPFLRPPPGLNPTPGSLPSQGANSRSSGLSTLRPPPGLSRVPVTSYPHEHPQEVAAIPAQGPPYPRGRRLFEVPASRPSTAQPPGYQANPTAPPPPSPLQRPLTPLEVSQKRVQDMIEAMKEDNKRLKRDKEFQNILLAHGLLYTACPDAWMTCNCEFCAGVRYSRQYQGLDSIGERLWNNPEYSFWREYQSKGDIKECKCDFCTGKSKDIRGTSSIERKPEKHGKTEVEVPENLAPDWNLWYGNRGDVDAITARNRAALEEAEFNKKLPKFDGLPVGPFPPEPTILSNNVEKPLFEMSYADIQHYHNHLQQSLANNSSSVATSVPSLQFTDFRTPVSDIDLGPPLKTHDPSAGHSYTSGTVVKPNLGGENGRYFGPLV